jgi:hypothetical protein
MEYSPLDNESDYNAVGGNPVAIRLTTESIELSMNSVTELVFPPYFFNAIMPVIPGA